MSPRVTIIMRTKDRPLFLRRAVASVASQTFSDYELVIINDAGEIEEVKSIIGDQSPEMQSRIVLVENEVSSGREAALDDAIDVSKGDLLTILDDDDTWAPQYLETAVRALNEHPEWAAVAVRSALIIEHLEGDSIIEDDRGTLALDKVSWNLIDSACGNYVPTNSQVIRRSVAEELGYWDRSLSTQADWDFNIRLLAKARVGFVDGAPLSFWHHRRDAVGASANSVYHAESEHRRDNLEIRQRRLDALLAGPTGEQDLARLLVVAEYARRLEERLDRLEARNATLEEIAASVTRLHDRIGILEPKIDRILGVGESTFIEVARLRDRVVSILRDIETRTSPKYWARVASSKIKGRLGR